MKRQVIQLSFFIFWLLLYSCCWLLAEDLPPLPPHGGEGSPGSKIGTVIGSIKVYSVGINKYEKTPWKIENKVPSDYLYAPTINAFHSDQAVNLEWFPDHLSGIEVTPKASYCSAGPIRDYKNILLRDFIFTEDKSSDVEITSPFGSVEYTPTGELAPGKTLDCGRIKLKINMGLIRFKLENWQKWKNKNASYCTRQSQVFLRCLG